MDKGEMRCMRCHGRKQIYKIMGGYSHVNTGGEKVDCPLCLGKGSIKTLEESIKEIEKQIKLRKIKNEVSEA